MNARSALHRSGKGSRGSTARSTRRKFASSGPSGEQLGIVSIAAANKTAEEAELDLVEIAPTAVPPVCRIMDYGKFKYRESKKRHEAKLKQKQIIVKESSFVPARTKAITRSSCAIWSASSRKATRRRSRLRFRGREMAHQEFGHPAARAVRNDLDAHSVVEQYPKMEGRQLVMVLAPKKVGGTSRAAESGAGRRRRRGMRRRSVHAAKAVAEAARRQQSKEVVARVLEVLHPEAPGAMLKEECHAEVEDQERRREAFQETRERRNQARAARTCATSLPRRTPSASVTCAAPLGWPRRTSRGAHDAAVLNPVFPCRKLLPPARSSL